MMRADLQGGETWALSGCDAEDFSGHQCKVEKPLHHSISAISNRTECPDQSTVWEKKDSWQQKEEVR